MWIVEKTVGIFTHYLTSSGKFQPGIERANKFVSFEMALVMARVLILLNAIANPRGAQHSLRRGRLPKL